MQVTWDPIGKLLLPPAEQLCVLQGLSPQICPVNKVLSGAIITSLPCVVLKAAGADPAECSVSEDPENEAERCKRRAVGLGPRRPAAA